MPIGQTLSNKIPVAFYQGFYMYMYTVSIAFVAFVYITHIYINRKRE